MEEKMMQVGRSKGYLFYVGEHEGKRLYNIVPEPKTEEEKKSFTPPAGGYFSREWIERVKGVRFDRIIRK